MALPLIPLIGFAALISFMIVYGLERTNRNWLVPLAAALSHPQGSFLKRTALKAIGAVISGISYVLRFVTHHLSVAASHSIAPVTAWVAGLAAWVTAIADAGGTFATETARAIETLTTRTLPKAIHKAVAVAEHEITIGLRHIRHEVELARRLLNGIDRLVKRRVFPLAQAAYHAGTVALPRAIGRVGARVGSLERELRHPSRAWLKRIARSMWALAFFGLLVRFLARRFPWLFCRKVGTLNKRVCGIDDTLLNTLLLDTLLIAGTISLRDEIRAMQAITKPTLSVIEDFIREPI